MTLSAGSRLGPYEIVAPLGAGGMGEVYRARDPKLRREVALKVLPDLVARDPERLARFEREAHVLASLNHPNIASIYGLEEADGVRALVMELVEGPTLAEHLEGGPLAVDESLAIARQITEALEEAHEHGIVHRDLKPANVKISLSGKVKVLDFGLAKAMEIGSGFGSASQLANSPTITHGATQLGTILGTAAYMAPEQAKGKPADKRADIWAFGVVLFEMLTGRRLFTGETVSETLAEVLKTEIDWTALPEETPPALRQLLRRVLERDPKNRLHDIADARIVLDEVASGRIEEAGPAPAAAPPVPARRGVKLLWLAACVTAAAAAALLGYLARGRQTAPAAPQRLSIQLAANQELVPGRNSLLGFSPDGEALYITGLENGRQTLFRRDLRRREATAVSGTEGAQSVFFSPDGKWIGFTQGGHLMKVPVEGGRPFQLGNALGAGGAAWLRDDTIVYAPIYSEGLYRIPAAGGTPERLTTPDRASGELGHWWPEPLPGERRILFTAFRTPVDRSRVGVLDLASREITWIVDGGFFGRYVPTGHLLYAKGQRLYALPFDPSTATAKGPAVAVLDDINVTPTGGYALVAVSSRGTLAYVTESLGHPVCELVWLDRTGRATPAASQRQRYLTASLSPDGRTAALTIRGESLDLWTLALERGTLSRQTSGEGTEFDPVWTRDGRELLYVVDRPPFELHRIAVGAPDSGQPIWNEPAELDATRASVSPDGRTIAFELTEPETGANLYARPLDGSGPPRAIRATRSMERDASFSPDGRWVVYQSDDTGRPEIYVQPFSGSGERIQVSSDGGSEPTWAGNGEIFYRRFDEMRVVATRTGGDFEFETPRTLFSFPILPGAEAESRTFAVTADGQRILAITIPEASRPRQIEIVTDWTSELARLVPGGSQ
jgi:Tol biopolymer transport system component